jgi:hypothetical protein
MKKREFKPQTKILNLDKDLNLGQDINIEVWKDPSWQACWELLAIFGLNEADELKNMPTADKEKMNEKYFYYASMILIDCDIKGIDFSTPEATEASFNDERLPWGIFHMALMLYMGELTREYSVLKNAIRRVNELSNSGTENSKNEEE